VAGKFEVSEQLGCVNRYEAFHSFDFNHDGILYQEVETQPRIDFMLLVSDRKHELTIEPHPALGELES
jgi:hypothetical protein